MDSYLIANLIFVIAPLTTLIHELGHVSGSLALKADYVQLCMGIGKRKSVTTYRRVEFIVYPFFFIGGFTRSERNKPYLKSERIWITILGPIFNGISALVSYLLNEVYPSEFLQLFFWFNIWMSFVNIIPFKINGKQTDGFTILELIRK
ncbi:site-2 protease family protein [Oceanobacillus saliphilus]|uniref:site-2 protease family protein n=1 Tax=Oceanobacillus saliphilus TaxID=2925834 RepID=UPI00201E62CB|nr:site-2 protease family protein [Oceanobacillus saliphilus]